MSEPTVTTAVESPLQQTSSPNHDGNDAMLSPGSNISATKKRPVSGESFPMNSTGAFNSGSSSTYFDDKVSNRTNTHICILLTNGY